VQTKKQARPVEFSEDRPKKRENPRTTQLGNLHVPRAVMYDGRLSHTTFRVAAWLYDHLRPGEHTATGSIRTIAADVGMSKATVENAIKQLFKYRIILTVGQELNNHNVRYNEYRMRVYDEQPKKLALVKPHRKPAVAPSPATLMRKVPSPVESDKNKPKTLFGRCAACAGRGVVFTGRPPKEIPCPMCTESV
jgi:DNA-binding Lrp family transcriptional regulator